MERSWNVALPAPPPPPVPTCTGFVTPQEYDRTSTSSLCLSSVDSPLISPSFAKMSIDMDAPQQIHRPRSDVPRTQWRSTAAIFCEPVEAGGLARESTVAAR